MNYSYIDRVSKHFAKNDAATCTMGLHQLRSIIIVGIFVGSNSLLIAYSYLNSFPLVGGSDSVAGIRAIIISTFLFLSFLSFAMVIRCASHLGYTLGASADDDMDEKIGVSYVQRMVSIFMFNVVLSFPHYYSFPWQDFLANNLSYHFAIGFRFIFVAIPFALLGAGITALVVSTALLLLFLFEFDNFAHHNNSTDAKRLIPHVKNSAINYQI